MQSHNISSLLHRLVLPLFALMLTTCTSQVATAEPFACTDALGCITIAPDDPVKIGSIQALTGNPAPIGLTQKQTIELVISQRRIFNHPIELYNVDAACSVEGGANAALRLVADPQIVGVIGTTCSGSAAGALPIISEAGFVMISGVNTAPSLTSILGDVGSNYKPGYFRMIPNGVQYGSVAADYAYHELGVSHAASIDDGDAFSTGVARVFRARFTELGGDVVANLTVNKGDENMLPLLEALALSH